VTEPPRHDHPAAETYGVVEQPPEAPKPAEVKLPDLDATETLSFRIINELEEGWKRLRQEYKAAAGGDLSAVHRKVLRFRDETLAGLLAGPHVPLGKDHVVDAVRKSAANVRQQVDALLAGR
jgi:hypothetical protein